MKKYSRKLAVKAILDGLNVQVFNAKFETFSLKCAVQKSIFNSALTNDNLVGYKGSLKNFVEAKKKNKKIVRDLYLNEGI
jgi:hypothetical protein